MLFQNVLGALYHLRLGDVEHLGEFCEVVRRLKLQHMTRKLQSLEEEMEEQVGGGGRGEQSFEF
jgi:hypothetical protein